MNDPLLGPETILQSDLYNVYDNTARVYAARFLAYTLDSIEMADSFKAEGGGDWLTAEGFYRNLITRCAELIQGY
jgi:hypothetical protein